MKDDIPNICVHNLRVGHTKSFSSSIYPQYAFKTATNIINNNKHWLQHSTVIKVLHNKFIKIVHDIKVTTFVLCASNVLCPLSVLRIRQQTF